MKKSVLLIFILILILNGCSVKKEENDITIPDYFAPVIQELQSSNEAMIPIMNVWWNESMPYSEEYADKIYTCCIDGNIYSFDLTAELTNGEQWNWRTAGIFQDEKEDKIYLCLHDYNIMYEDNVVQEPQLLLIEFFAEKPEEYKVWPYIIEPSYLFGWDVVCYRMQDNIFIAGEKDLAVINLDTKLLRYCKEEYSYAEKCIKEKFGEDPYHIFFFRAIYEQDGVIVYSAEISEADDVPPIGMIYIAHNGNDLIAYMTVDLTTDGMADYKVTFGGGHICNLRFCFGKIAVCGFIFY